VYNTGMKLLDGRELAGFIMERQAHEARSLLQSRGIQPKLAIIRTNPHPVVDTYMHLKESYGEEVGVDVDVIACTQQEAIQRIEQLNDDPTVHGIIVQLPLPDTEQTTPVLNAVTVAKDVDGLAENSPFDAPTAVAINWLLAGYNVNLPGKNITIVGHGRLVGAPLARIFRSSGLEPVIADKNTADLPAATKEADILISATGVPGLITAEMVKPDAVIVDAGVATDKNGLAGDIHASVRELPNIMITPISGGVGPLTVCALFDNVLRAARDSVQV
jgi:methylenetetrahydrofolate dehydrogenase (NADP+)/methenyltetrahydrofolate cyclohydrolase